MATDPMLPHDSIKLGDWLSLHDAHYCVVGSNSIVKIRKKKYVIDAQS